MALALTLAALLMALLVWRAGSKDPARPPITGAGITAMLAIPPLFIALSLIGAQGRMGETRLVLKALSFDQRALRSAPFSVGGDQAADDLVVSGAPSGLVQVRVGEGRTSLIARPLATGGVNPTVVSVKGKGFVGAVPFGAGDRVCLERCDGEGRWFEMTGSGRLVVVGDPEATLPEMPTRRLFFNLLPGLGYWKPAQRIYPLRDFAQPRDRETQDDTDPCLGRFLCVKGADGQPTPARTFLFRKGGAGLMNGGAMSILLLDPGAQLRRPSGDIVHPTREETLLTWSDGDKPSSADLSLWRVGYVDAEVHPEDAKAPASRLVESREMSVTLDRQVVARLATPKVLVARPGGSQGPALFELMGNAEGAPPPPNGMQRLALDPVGGRLATALSARLIIDPASPWPIQSEADNGRAAVRFGDTFWSGSSSRDRQGVRLVQLQVDQLNLPLLAILITSLWSLVLAVSLNPAWVNGAPLAWIIPAMCQLMLALRVTAGFAGATLDPDLSWREILASDLTAYVAFPALLAQLTPLPAGRAWIGRTAVTVFLICSVAAIWIAYGRPGLLPLALAVAAVAAALNPNSGFARQATGWVPGWLANGERASRTWLETALAKPGPDLAYWVLGAALVFRVILLLVNIKERFPPPFTLAVSAVYLPWLLTGFALLFQQARRDPAGLRPLVGFLAALALDVVLAPLAVNDIGFAIYFLPLSFWGVLVAIDAWRVGAWRMAAAWATPACGVLVVLAGLLAAALLFGNPISEARLRQLGDPQNDDKAAIAAVQGVETSQNLLRLFNIANPHLVETAGTREAENLRVWSAYLQDYSRSLLGEGYLRPSRLGPLKDVQLTDNVSAVHLMSPFGRAGAAALLLLIALCALASHRLTPAARDGARDWRQTLGLLALWTLFGADAYMVMANLQLTPFTGRNLYFMAAGSDSDLAEGAILVLLAFWFLARREAAR